MNNLTSEQIRLTTKFSNIPEIGYLLLREETEWKAIVYIQNGLDEKNCAKYLNALDKLKCNLVNATVDQRIQAFINIHQGLDVR
jgi:hypothetical protein